MNLVPSPAPVTVGDLPPGLVSVDDFHAETFQDSRIFRGGLVTLIATPLLERQALMLGMVTLCVHWTCSPRF